MSHRETDWCRMTCWIWMTTFGHFSFPSPPRCPNEALAHLMAVKCSLIPSLIGPLSGRGHRAKPKYDKDKKKSVSTWWNKHARPGRTSSSDTSRAFQRRSQLLTFQPETRSVFFHHCWPGRALKRLMGNKRALQTHKILTTPLAGHKSAFMCCTSAGGLSEYYTSARWHQFDKSTVKMKIVVAQRMKHVKEKKQRSVEE